MYRLPQHLIPLPKETAVLELDLKTKQVLRYYEDSTNAKLSMITSAVERDGYLYLGSFFKNIYKLKLWGSMRWNSSTDS